jgi:hypothetical protein
MESFEVMTRRLFPRVRCAVTVAFEIVKWDEKKPSPLKNPTRITAFDLSSAGIGVMGALAVTGAQEKKLNQGTAKIRLAICLDEAHDPVYSFARLIWMTPPLAAIADSDQQRYGFSLIDTSPDDFERLQKFVGSQLTQKT